ncbi:MAG: cysteine desulfurase [Spirochaetales bacterium]|nr:cysteine desulfurase [Spirochaetales bacterium]
MNRVYLDWAATALPDEAIVREVSRTALDYWGNPSSKHPPGRNAARFLAEARGRCAAALDLPEDTLVFTSGGTESNNMVIFSLLHRPRKGRVIVSNLEHPSCLEPVAALERFAFHQDKARAQSSGALSPEGVEALLTPDTVMVVIMAVNNETGNIQPLQEIVRRIRLWEKKNGRPVHIHTDAVQAFGKIPFHPEELGVDSASLSAHKLSGPRGVGLLYLRKPLEFLYRGGGQEKGFRSGTENLPGIYGLTLAVEKTFSDAPGRLKRAEDLSEHLLEGMKALPGVQPVPQRNRENAALFSPWILSLAAPPLPGEVLLRMLGEKGIDVSTGSACSSGKKGGSRVLKALGADEALSRSMIRVSVGPTTTKEELDTFLATLETLLPQGRR